MASLRQHIQLIRRQITGSPEQYSLEHRFFNAASFFAGTASLLATTINIFLQLYIGLILITLLGSLVNYLFYYLSLRKKYYRKLITPFIFISLLIVSFVWFINSGLDGPVIYFYFIGIILFSILTKGSKRLLAIILTILAFSVLLLIEYLNPELVYDYQSRNARFMDVYLTAIIAMLVISGMTIIIIKSYYNEQKTITDQQYKIIKQNTDLKQKEQELRGHKEKLESQVAYRTKELQKANIQLEKAIAKASEADQLKSSFLANMSHEIRTPLNAILGFAELLKTEKDEATIYEYIDIITNKGNLLLNIINDIIDISKVESGKLNIHKINFNVDKVLQEIFITYQKVIALEKSETVNLRLVKPSNESSISIFNDPARLKQVIQNLVDNAVKFTKKGEITLGYRLEEVEGSQQIIFFVKDTGTGIKEEHRKFIFDPFRQIDESLTRNYTGTGLGLSISKRLVELMGGTLQVRSEINKGSYFYFNLPYDNTIAFTAEEPKKKKSFHYNWENKTILIAEDYNAGFELLKSYFMKTGVKIIRAVNGEEAVKLCNSDPAIDLVLMDIQMPVMNGFEATRLIKNVHPNLPVIAQTAYAMGEDEVKAREAGCDDYIAKPIIREKIMQKIQHFLFSSEK